MLKRQPKQVELRGLLMAALAGGDYAVGSALPSEKDMALRYGVSRTTVREAIASLAYEGLVTRSQGKRICVAKLPEEARDIVFVLCGRDYTDPYYSRVLKGVEDRAARLGYRLMYTHWSQPDDRRGIENALLNHRPVKGIVVTGNLDLRQLMALMDMNANMVLVGDISGPARTPDIVTRIVSNEYTAAYEAVKLLVGLGHTRIGHIAGNQKSCWFRESHDAYRKCLADHGLPSEPGLVAECPGQELADGTRAAEGLLQLADRPTALFAANDRLAWGAVQALRYARLGIPDDISIVATGDLPLGDQRDWLTTMRVSQEEMGALAVDQVVAGAGGRTEAIVVPMTLALRKSCAPAGGRHLGRRPIALCGSALKEGKP